MIGKSEACCAFERIKMGDGALTKAQLDEVTAAWRRWRAERGEPVEHKAMGRSAPAEPALSPHDMALLKGISSAFHDEIEALKARIAELESGAMKYCGVHQASIAYRKGHVVTFDGAAWCDTRDVSVERPGHGDGWQLMVKSGRDMPTPSPHSDASATASQRVNGQHPNPRMR
jgi:hypothetical protein